MGLHRPTDAQPNRCAVMLVDNTGRALLHTS
jgi:hypothetical protein